MSDCSSQRSRANVTIAGAVADVVVGAWRGRVAGGGGELLGIDAGCRRAGRLKAGTGYCR